MRAQYGNQHGFNWKVGEAVGMQLVTVPATDAIANAHAACGDTWWPTSWSSLRRSSS
jgi:hypothetical protein